MTTQSSPADRTSRLLATIERAAAVVAPVWPIDSFIAVNPLSGLEDRRFEDAIRRAGELFGARGTLSEPEFRALHVIGRISDAELLAELASRMPEVAEGETLSVGGATVDIADILLADLLRGEPAPAVLPTVKTRAARVDPSIAATVDRQLAKWCTTCFGAGGATWAMPDRAAGLFAAWRELAPHDRELPGTVRRRVAELPRTAAAALLDALDDLGLAEDAWHGHLEALLVRLPGWAGHARWRATRGAEPAALLDLLTIGTVLEAELLRLSPTSDEPTPEPHTFVASASDARVDRAERVLRHLRIEPADDELDDVADLLDLLPAGSRLTIWLGAYERRYRDGLLLGLEQSEPYAARSERPTAQVVCCIDTRSEGLRRHLEAVGRVETFGFAGFFGAAIRFQEIAAGSGTDLCPALIEPAHEVVERTSDRAGNDRALARRQGAAGAHAALEGAAHGTLAPFALVESAGWLAAPTAAVKTFAARPYARIRRRLRPEPTDAGVTIDLSAITDEEQTDLAAGALTAMGLTSAFARLVVLCAHGSTTANNPYGAALDCGACGGHRGGANARTVAAILNRKEVRRALALRGIVVPDDTWVVAAEHDTATDTVAFLEPHLVPPTHRDDVDALGVAFAEAGRRLAAERMADLPGARAKGLASRHAASRSADWAQVYPEWGLAGNAAMVIGPRALTQGLDLGRRVFLHSYDAAADQHGEALETILTAPLVVAQWINAQYYFSTVDREAFGAGSKTVHNVVPGVGVIAGHSGDLLTGLPWQSVAVGDRRVHEPMRLLAVVEAPLERIADICARSAGLRQLIDHEWITLVARPDAGTPWARLHEGGWNRWTFATAHYGQRWRSAEIVAGAVA